jgi:adenosylmethionine-8-amino-7-oxononanoate aminotransferase
VRFVPAPVPYRRPPGQSEEAYGLACAEALDAAITEEGPETVAAFIAEPVLGASASGAVPPPGYFPAVREICDRYGVLLIADEVMTGMGRTGRPFAMEHWGVVPDMTAVGKGLTGGYAPLAALLVHDRVYAAIAEGSGRFVHGHTFSAHPASCVVGLAALHDLYERRLITAAAVRGPQLRERLAKVATRHHVIGDVRGLGLMVGVEFVADRETRAPFPPEVEVAPRVVQACASRGLLVYPGRAAVDGRQGDHLLFGPPFCISEEELDEAVTRFDYALSEVEPALLGAPGLWGGGGGGHSA